ncbi:peptidase U32 family protein [Butyrivibrio sp. AE3006]|uniref:peptidase U32 family protein n=1 Tax=Butyrivibrio sp. AE3006 TaxID=1280673 RepID=UPI0004096ECA|nr:U32 family peptidase [Butyrivibrio sp. AE3006]
MNKVELLAPAGNYETMLGAFAAGADAVYLGGQGFGARAFADNFTEEEVVSAIRYAHLHGKKIYLTTNILLKENEIDSFKEFFEPYAYAGLDGAIIQDLGVFKIISEEFPWVERHASTQMTITGPEGARLLKELGATRVVPARELTLDEIHGIHEYCKKIDGEGIEIEAFIHGAMCYSYSGACLFSSMVGERSGNRGRCAQPCRLPYKLNGHGKECYPLSLKDMCMVDRIPELIEAGINSFKIEGRMKKPEYAAGVTSVYRRFIDKYYEAIASGKEKGTVKLLSNAGDKKILSSLYLRSEIGEGYYFRHNSKDMVTLENPSYNGSDEEVLREVGEQYLSGKKLIPIDLKCELIADKEAALTLTTVTDDHVSVTVTGDIVQRAQNRPMALEDCKKQLLKFGNSEFSVSSCDITLDDAGIFMPVKALNELRRKAAADLEKAIIKSRGYEENIEMPPIERLPRSEYKHEKIKSFINKPTLCISVMSKAQLDVVSQECVNRGNIDRVIVDSRLLLLNEELPDMGRAEVFAALPYVLRCEKGIPDRYDLKRILDYADKFGLDGIVVRNLEELSYALHYGYKGRIVPDYGLYLWNEEAFKLYGEILKNQGFSDFSLPLELSYPEMNDTMKGIYGHIISSGRHEQISLPTAMLQVYGRVPMMHTANCIRNTFGDCTGKRGGEVFYETIFINDRTGRTMPVTYDCRYCTNIIWNSVPVSLFKKADKLSSFSSKYNTCFRVDLTTEKADVSRDIIRGYEELLKFGSGKDKDMYIEKLLSMDYTTGHFERSAD